MISNQFTKQLKALCLLAKEAGNGFEKAAIFSATELFVANFLDRNAYCEDVNHRIQGIKYHINAALGYESANGYHSSSHTDWALLEIDALLSLTIDTTDKIVLISDVG
ncbi:hypothetical protein [Shewanella surugensis]|uniref:Uncharacterized protein n=1 Tax=Shewanella surugensis TaxID=212020 RepID=A0ABT0LFY8_9GAMM|nr:hypothetical protein [Shewanella surugensis]MCL1126575.1 hypothetical protein [Shewanella surugensis]